MKKNSPKKHHYVPKVYLKGFTNANGDFFQLDIQHNTISTKKPAQVGYELDYFKLQRPETKVVNQISDDYLIEKRSFLAQENMYQHLVDEIALKSDKPFLISRKNAELLLQTLITIKRRNPSFKSLMTAGIKHHATSDAFKQQIAPYLNFLRQIGESDPMEYIDRVTTELKTDDSRASDLYVTGFLDLAGGITKEVASTMLQSKIQIWHVPDGFEFVTSDNPGFTFSGDQVINFGGLADPYLFGFPLSPEACLIIDSEKLSTSNDDTTILVYPAIASDRQMKMINDATRFIALKKLFFRSKNMLEA